MCAHEQGSRCLQMSDEQQVSVGTAAAWPGSPMLPRHPASLARCPHRTTRLEPRRTRERREACTCGRCRRVAARCQGAVCRPRSPCTSVSPSSSSRGARRLLLPLLHSVSYRVAPAWNATACGGLWFKLACGPIQKILSLDSKRWFGTAISIPQRCRQLYHYLGEVGCQKVHNGIRKCTF